MVARIFIGSSASDRPSFSSPAAPSAQDQTGHVRRSGVTTARSLSVRPCMVKRATRLVKPPNMSVNQANNLQKMKGSRCCAGGQKVNCEPLRTRNAISHRFRVGAIV